VSRHAVGRRLLGVSRRRLAVALCLTALAAAFVFVVLGEGLLSVSVGASEAAADLLERYGLAALLGVFVVEGLMLLYFAPSESLVPAALLVLGDGPGRLAAILTVAVVGATLGQVALFLVARRAGREYVIERGWIGVTEPQLEHFDAWFDRWGPLAVPVSNTMLFVRGMLTVPAGLSEMDLRTFVALSALGTLCFETILAALTLGVLGFL